MCLCCFSLVCFVLLTGCFSSFVSVAFSFASLVCFLDVLLLVFALRAGCFSSFTSCIRVF